MKTVCVFDEKPSEVVVEQREGTAYIFIHEDIEEVSTSTDDGETIQWQCTRYEGSIPWFEGIYDIVSSSVDDWVEYLEENENIEDVSLTVDDLALAIAELGDVVFGEA